MASYEDKSERLRPLPVVRDFMLCEKIIKDQLQGKMSLIDVFDNIQGAKFPMKFACWYFCSLTDGHGQFEFEVWLHNIETDKRVKIWEGACMLQPAKTAALINMITPVFEAAGLYEFVIQARDGRRIGTRSFTVSLIPDTANPVI